MHFFFFQLRGHFFSGLVLSLLSKSIWIMLVLIPACDHTSPGWLVNCTINVLRRVTQKQSSQPLLFLSDQMGTSYKGSITKEETSCGSLWHLSFGLEWKERGSRRNKHNPKQKILEREKLQLFGEGKEVAIKINMALKFRAKILLSPLMPLAFSLCCMSWRQARKHKSTLP